MRNWRLTLGVFFLFAQLALAESRTYWVYDIGYFKKQADNGWQEFQNEQLAFSFIEVLRDNDQVILYDRSRDMYVALQNEKFQLKVGQNGSYTDFKAGHWVERSEVIPPAPPFPGDRERDRIIFRPGQRDKVIPKTPHVPPGTVPIRGGQVAMCVDDPHSLRWPLRGTNGRDYIVSNYFDSDQNVGAMKDLNDNKGSDARTYDQHTGIDIDIASFRAMDAGVPVYAAAGGLVHSVEINNFDRNVDWSPGGCGGANFVKIIHNNGYAALYYHFRKDSIVVKANDIVQQGQLLGYVGSSGCSAAPHLHFEMQDCSNQPFEPIGRQLFADPPAYELSLELMDVAIRKGPLLDPTDRPFNVLMKDPAPNVQVFPLGSRMGIGASVGGGRDGDTITAIIRRPNGEIYQRYSPIILRGSTGHSYPQWSVVLPTAHEYGPPWQIEIIFNGNIVRTEKFILSNNQDAVFTGSSEAAATANFKSVVSDGYVPTWVDGATASEGGARISTIYRRKTEAFDISWSMDVAGYQQKYQAQLAAGRQLLQVDTYVRDGAIRWATLWGPPPGGTWHSVFNVNFADHVKYFNERKNLGFRPYVISVAKLNGTEYFTALYTTKNAGSWETHHGYTGQQLQAEIDIQLRRNRGLAYVDAYDDNGTPRFSAIFTEEANRSRWIFYQELLESEFNVYNQEKIREGYAPIQVTSYLLGGQRRFAGIWRQ